MSKANKRCRSICTHAAFGCGRPVVPPGAWLTYISDDRVVLRCNDTRGRGHDVISWTMTCRSSRWVGGDDVTDDVCQSASSAIASLSEWAVPTLTVSMYYIHLLHGLPSTEAEGDLVWIGCSACCLSVRPVPALKT